MVRMNIVFIHLIVSVFLTSCKEGKPQRNKDMKLIKPTSEIALDTTKESFEVRKLKDNVFFKTVKLSDTTYTLKWGIQNKQSYFSKRPFEKLGSGMLEYLTSNDSVIILSQSCGTSCTYFAMLPLSGREPLLYYHPQAIDLNRNLIVYSPVEYADSVFLIVENYLTGQKIFLKENNLCPALFKGECIEVCYFDGNDLVLKWQGSKWKNWDKPDLQTKRISIEL